MQNKINFLKEKISHPININQELDIKLPILSQEELQLFEEQLEEERFKNQVVQYLISAIFVLSVVVYTQTDICKLDSNFTGIK